MVAHVRPVAHARLVLLAVVSYIGKSPYKNIRYYLIILNNTRMTIFGNGKHAGPVLGRGALYFPTRRANNAARELNAEMRKNPKMLRENAARIVQLRRKTLKNGFSHENPLARSRVGSTASDPHNLSSIVGINDRPRSGIPFSQLNSNARAALKESFKATFARRFPGIKTKKSSKQRIENARSRAAARQANRTRSAASKAKEENEASKRLNVFSKGLSNRGATGTLSKAQQVLLGYKKK